MKILWICCVLLTGCSYHFGKGGLSDSYSTVTIPYVKGDSRGLMTSALVRTMSQQGGVKYLSSGGELILNVEVKSHRTDPVGFRFETNAQGERLGALVAAEDRTSLLAIVELIESVTHKVVLGPLYITGSVDYDFQPDTANTDLTQFSLGQVDYRLSGKDSAYDPLYDQVALKIINMINAYWE